MNSTPLEDQVHDALHRQVDPMQHSPLTVTDVRQRARLIQRRRTIAAGAAVAAALAVAVPVGLAMDGPARRSDVPPATQTPTITGPVRIDPRSASVGDPPHVTLVDATTRTLVAGGEEYVLPESYDQITRYRDGWIAVFDDQRAPTLHILDSRFDVVEYVLNASALTVTDDGSRVAYTNHDGYRWVVVDNEVTGEQAERTTALPNGSVEARVRTVGFLPDDGLVAAQTDPADGTETTFIVTPEGTTKPLPGLIEAVSASPATGMVAGLTSVDMESAQSCSALVDGRDSNGDAAWETCDHQLGAFSPDGQHLVGLAEYFDGPGSPSLSILDATTGEPVIDFELTAAPQRVVAIAPEVVWEDDQTLLATYIDGTEQYVVRLGLDGTVERVAGPVTNDDSTLSLRLTPGRID
ncbi:hypothetical protein [Nocardioides astragali]|uniref:WD40 repeat domain-containing protein n=1 Tax=Nocardioides astragali TaxID=1776736 RepID=A0ABW2N7B0_9ACTN|nr:hypothetical protein [Nocardioides astragali]